MNKSLIAKAEEVMVNVMMQSSELFDFDGAVQEVKYAFGHEEEQEVNADDLRGAYLKALAYVADAHICNVLHDSGDWDDAIQTKAEYVNT